LGEEKVESWDECGERRDQLGDADLMARREGRDNTGRARREGREPRFAPMAGTGTGKRRARAAVLDLIVDGSQWWVEE